MDGGDRDLQYLAIVTAAHVQADAFLQDVLLDPEVADVLKVETLRLLLERNEEALWGLVLCNIYKKVFLPRIKIGRKRRKRFVEAYAKVTSKFVMIHDNYGNKLKEAAEMLYRALESCESLDLVNNVDDCACAIYVLSGLKELGSDIDMLAMAFEAKTESVKELLQLALGDKYHANFRAAQFKE